MKTPVFKHSFVALLLLALTFSATKKATAQSVNVTTDYPSTLTKRTSGSIATSLTRSGFGFSGTWSWNASPNTGVTFGGNASDQTRTVTFGSTAAVGTYTITVQRGSNSASFTITLTDGTNANLNLWAARSIDGNTSRVETYAVNGTTVNLGPSTLFYTGETFAALARSPYPTVNTGFFYWIPYSAGNNGELTVKGVNGDGTTPTTVLPSFDINGSSNSDVTFVRFAMDKDGAGWTLTKTGNTTPRLNLTKITFSGLGSASATVIDDEITLSGGSISTFENGDLCLDGNGNIFALANISNSTTEIYIGQPNGTSTTLTKRWEIKDNLGNDFTGSVNGCAFDADGAMYISTGEGIYYLDPGTIEAGTTGVSTVQAKLVIALPNYTDLGTNVFPTSTPLPTHFGALTATEQNGSLVVNWETTWEKNVKEYIVEASKDGKVWHEIGKVGSKAANGNSDSAQSYQLVVNSSLALGAISLAILLLIPSFRSRLLRACLGAAVIVMVVTACSKQDIADVKSAETIYVRIAQYDIDSAKPDYSKVVMVVRQ